MRTISRLKEIINSNNSIDAMIAHTILINYEKGNSLKAKVISKICNVSVSTLTAFAKRLGYDGYSELYYRVVIEKEFYKATESGVLQETMQINEKRINELAEKIIKSKKVFILKSEEVSEIIIDLFVSLLSKNKRVYFSNKRKLEKYYINEIDDQSLIIIFATGLEINELWNNVDLFSQYSGSFYFITTSANEHLISRYNSQKNVMYIENKKNARNPEIRLMKRIHEIDKLIIEITKAYAKNFYEM